MQAARNWERFGLSFSLALMWAGVLWSRAMLSIGMGLLIICSLMSVNFMENWRNIRRSPYLIGLVILFMIPFISILWSEDLRWWLKVMQDKLPLLCIPFCCLALQRMDEKLRQNLIKLVLVLVAISIMKSIIGYLLNQREITEAYLKAKVMAVDMHGDHVRYGWLLALIFAWLLHAITEKRSSFTMTEYRLTIGLTILIALYLHLLASKTGLLGLYLSIGIWVLFHWRKTWVRWMAGATLFLPVLAWFLLPTFRNRLKFILWDFQHYTRGGYTEGLSDTPRVLSFDAGRQLVSDHPWLGTGFGDLRRSMNDWYGLHAPFMKEYEQLLPSNEILLHAAAAGIPLTILFLIVILRPLTLSSHRHSTAWISFHVIALAGFLYEIGLETQYGIFIYAFLGCWCWLFMGRPGQPGSGPAIPQPKSTPL
jgi:O-antigen ligase